MRQAAARECARIELDLGRAGEAAARLGALVRSQPLDAGLRELLMLALHRSGRRAEALATYQDVHQLLVDEVGVEPAAALQELHHGSALSTRTCVPRWPWPAAGPSSPASSRACFTPFLSSVPCGVSWPRSAGWDGPRRERPRMRTGRVSCLVDLSIALESVGRIDAAVDCLVQALAVHRGAGDRVSETVALANMANLHRVAGGYDAAIDLSAKSWPSPGRRATRHTWPGRC